MIHRLLNNIPGSEGTKVFVGFVGIMSFCGFTFFGGKKKRSGEGAFDTERYLFKIYVFLLKFY
jgi:hypothetical protein